MSAIDPTTLEDKLFKIKKLQYNTYDIEHSAVKGQLRLIIIPKNFAQLPRQSGTKGLPQIGVSSQTIIGFTNRGKKMKPKNSNVTPETLSDEEKEDITTFVENSNEPWNEFVLEGNFLIRLKAVLTKVTWLKTSVNTGGDPTLWANSSVNIEVFENKTGEAGLQ